MKAGFGASLAADHGSVSPLTGVQAGGSRCWIRRQQRPVVGPVDGKLAAAGRGPCAARQRSARAHQVSQCGG